MAAYESNYCDSRSKAPVASHDIIIGQPFRPRQILTAVTNYTHGTQLSNAKGGDAGSSIRHSVMSIDAKWHASHAWRNDEWTNGHDLLLRLTAEFGVCSSVVV